MEIIEYNNTLDILVKFIECGNIVHTQWHRFCDGKVKNVFDKSVFGIGYLGEGNYKNKINGKNSREYDTWHGMLQRCYSENTLKRRPTYAECTVAEEWHNFQNFAKWYNDNYYDVDGDRVHLDKDILIKNNKIYSPETCVFVPQRINALFIKHDMHRGELPLGVRKTNRNKVRPYAVQIQNGTGQQGLGYFDNIEDAFACYKKHKEKLIKFVANEYKDRIPDRLYQAMLRYEVEITD